MPTPVSTAKQFLTDEAARILDEAVAVAHRRVHSQTTSLHVISALLSLPSSLLREACSSRLRLRALDLCVSVSLDQLPSSRSTHDNPPPVSNSLLVAIKRSQACQRRQSEMHQVTPSLSTSNYSISSIKVEIKTFVASILDDPIVSRVLGDAGLCSTDIKQAILHHPAPARHSRGVGERSRPSNLTQTRSSVGDKNCKRIGEILAKGSGRNPIIVGVCAKEVLKKFKKRLLNGRGEGVLPCQIDGVDFICVEREIMEFVLNGGSKDAVESKLKELGSALDCHLGPGLVVNIGELKVLVEAGQEAVNVLVSKLSIVFKIYKKKMWLIGSVAGYGTYEKFLNRFPSLEVEWDLHPLPINSFRSSAAEANIKSRLLRSFVPLGGFFSSPSHCRRPLCTTNKPFARCGACDENYKHELSVIKCKVSSVSAADQLSSSLPSWLQLASSSLSKAHNNVTMGDEKAEPSAKVLWLQRKWDDLCKSLHQKGPETCTPVLPCTMVVQDTTDVLDSGDVPSMLQVVTSSQEQNVITSSGSPKSDSHVSKSPSRQSSSCNINLSSDHHASSSSISCVITDLGLGPPASAAPQELERSDSHLRSVKLVMEKLAEKVGWQVEACYKVGQILCCRGGGNGGRRDTWIGFMGPDKVGKMKMAAALAELVFGSKEHLISVDLSGQKKRMNGSQHSVYDSSLRIGTMVDYIARELSRRQCCLVILLENVDNINDPLAQRSVLHAIQSGKFLDSHGRETSTMNAIFLVTCSSTEEEEEEDQDQDQSISDNAINFSDKNIAEVGSWQMQIVVEHLKGRLQLHTSSLTLANKRNENDTDDPSRQKKPKLFFDLNQPLDEDTDNSRSWFTHFLEQVDRRVTFKAVNFDPLASRLLHKMSLSLPKTTSAFTLEVGQEVMSQIVAASLYSDEEAPIDDWIKEVFGKACGEAHKIYSSHPQTGLKLVSCPGLAIDKQAPGICLPGIINLG